MANNNPRFLLRDCMAWADRQSLIGQIGSVSLPVVSVKVEELRNGGMAMPIEVMLGYEKLEYSIKMPGFDPQVLALFGMKPGVTTPLMITGATVDEDGTEHSAVANLQGFLKQGDPGEWTVGEMAENEFQYSGRYYKLEIDGQPIFEVDPFDVKIKGVSQYAGVRRALLLD